MTTTTVTVDVEIDLEEIDDDDLIEEIESRGYEIHNPDQECAEDELIKIYKLITLNKKDEAIQEMHEYLREKLGRAL